MYNVKTFKHKYVDIACIHNLRGAPLDGIFKHISIRGYVIVVCPVSSPAEHIDIVS